MAGFSSRHSLFLGKALWKQGRIFSRMMAFARRVDYRYHCLSVDKKFIDSPNQILGRLKTGLADFIAEHQDVISSLGCVKIYYDCGQSPVTRMLHEVFETGIRREGEQQNENNKKAALGGSAASLYLGLWLPYTCLRMACR